MRTIVVWLALVVAFVVLYQFFSYAPHEGQGAPSPFDFPVVWFGLLVVFLGLFVFFIRRQRLSMGSSNEGYVLMQQGRFAEALPKFEEARKRMPRNPVPILNLGSVRLALWRVRESTSAFEEFHRRATRRLTMVPGMAGVEAPFLAYAYALLGDEALARTWLEASGKRGHTAVSHLAQIVLACRANDFSGARVLLEQHAVQLDQLGGVYRATWDALHAYVASQTGTHGGAVDPVRLFRESGPEGLKAAWPELHSFVERASRGPVVG